MYSTTIDTGPVITGAVLISVLVEIWVLKASGCLSYLARVLRPHPYYYNYYAHTFHHYNNSDISMPECCAV